MPMFLKLLVGKNRATPGTGTFCVLSILVMPWQCCCSLSTLPLYPSPQCCITKLCKFGPEKCRYDFVLKDFNHKLQTLIQTSLFIKLNCGMKGS